MSEIPIAALTEEEELAPPHKKSRISSTTEAAAAPELALPPDQGFVFQLYKISENCPKICIEEISGTNLKNVPT